MKKFIQFIKHMPRRALLALGLFALPGLSMAEGTGSSITPTSYTVPSSVTDAVNGLAGAADGYAAVILPYIAYIGLAFIGIAVVYLLFKVFKRFVGGR